MSLPLFITIAFVGLWFVVWFREQRPRRSRSIRLARLNPRPFL